MSILVTGAAGFIGSHLTDRLLSLGHDVIGLDNFDPFYAERIKHENLEGALGHDGFTLVRGDIRDRIALEALPEGVDLVVHLAAKAGVRPSIEDPVGYTDVNLMGTSQLLEWSKRRGIEAFVFASSSSVYGNNEKVPFAESDPVDHPISPYAATKKGGELLCHTASHLNGTAISCLRFFTVYGPRQRPDLAIRKFARLLRSGEEIPMFGDGSTSRDYTYVDDTVGGILGAIEWVRSNPGGFDVFNLGNDRTVTLQEMISTIAQEMNVDARIRQLPMQPGDVDRTWADIGKARGELRYAPRVEFGEGVGRFLGWFAGRA